MKVKILTNINELDISRDQWDNLVSENETNTIFQTYDWINCWWTIFGEKDRLFLIHVHDDGNKLLGIAPLTLKISLRGKRHLVFLGDGNADYLDFIIPRHKERVLQTILVAIKNSKQDWDQVFLRNVPQQSATTGLVKSLSKQIGIHYAIDKVIACPTLLIKNREEMAKNFADKYSTKRSYNYFSKIGKLRHEIINKLDDVDSELNKFFYQHIERWKDTSTPSLFLNKQNINFYRELANTLLPTHNLLFSKVTHNDSAISYHFGFDYNSIVTWYKPSFDIQYSKHSPGTVMVKYLIEYCLVNEKHELDFTIGNESFKKRFTNLIRYNNDLIIFMSTRQFFLNRFVSVFKYLAKRIISIPVFAKNNRH